jgi:dihydroorotate dehydrogenase (NAD+) catalytic subunit
MDVSIGSLRLPGPVLTASGTFGYGTEYAEGSSLRGLGGIVCKGTTLQPRTGNAPLRLTETAAGMLNAIGLQNMGVDAVIREKAPTWATWDVPVLVNVSGSTTEEYAEVARRLDGVPGVSGIELNISCPNVKEGGVAFGTSPRLAAEVTAAVRRSASLPLVVKLSPNVSDIRSIAAAVETAGADAVSLINTVYAMQVDVRRRAPVLENVSGGLSGPAIKPYALYLVYQVAQEVSVPVVGMGGILRWQDAAEFILAGASAVAVGTALLVDPDSWRDIASGLEAWTRREGPALRDLVGAANPRFKGKVADTASSAGHR